jgi:hypothetical protein
MTKTLRRVQFVYHRGQRLPPNTKSVTRPSRFGNRVSRPKERTIESHAEAVAEYCRWAMAPEQADFRQLAREHLRGYNLACSCPEGWPCHADVLLEVANAEGAECRK